MTAGEAEAYREIRDRLVDERLGAYESYRFITLCGFFLLLIAFAFMTLASCERFASSTRETAASVLSLQAIDGVVQTLDVIRFYF